MASSKKENNTKKNKNTKKTTNAKKAANKTSNNKKKQNKQKKKIFTGRFSLDILDILIIIVITTIISCVVTGTILNHQYKKIINATDNVVQDENVQNFLNTYQEITDNYYEEVDKDKLMEAALDGMLEYLGDNYSIYLDEESTEELSEQLDGSYQGIGIVAVGNVVYSVYEDSPAEKAGIKEGDIITKINGTEITEENSSDVSSYLKSDEENEIIVKRNKEELTFNIKKGDVYIPSVSNEIIELKKKKIGYIQMGFFSSNSADEFESALLELEEKDIDSLIIDLRSNIGGYVSAAYDIAELFIKKGELIYSVESKNEKKEYKDETDEYHKYKIVILVNENTASASEILASALKDSYGATLVGKKTYGKGKIQAMKYVNNKMVKYTIGKWYRPNGECIDEIGITPDYEVDIEYKDNTIYDKQYDKALELLK